VGWVTLRPTAVHSVRTKPAACGRLRLSSYNCADQSSIVIESLPSESAVHQQRATRRWAVVDKKWAVWQSGGSLLETYPRVASGLTAACGLPTLLISPPTPPTCRLSKPRSMVSGSSASGPRVRCALLAQELASGGAQHRQRRHHDGAVAPVPGRVSNTDAMTNVTSNSSSSGVATRCGSCGPRPEAMVPDHDVWVACGFAHPKYFHPVSIE
jgi:hypothetical protein